MVLAIVSMFLFTACDKDEDPIINPIETGVEISIRNTFESAYFSNYPGWEVFANETPYGDTATGSVGSGVEITSYLGLYDIDLSNNTIIYKLAETAPEGITFRTIEEGTFDRYYITFNKPQAFKSLTVDDEFVHASILSDTKIKVEISAGYDFNSGRTFTILVK